MGIAKEIPDHGIRVRLERTASGYAGTATTKDAQWNVTCAIDDVGEVTVSSDAPSAVSERVRLMVRIEARNAKAAGVRPPRVIQRWRAEKD